MQRREVLKAIAGSSVLAGLPGAAGTAALARQWGGFDELVDLARSLSEDQPRRVAPVEGAFWRNLGYDGLRSIRFRPEAAIALGQSDFALQLFHLGHFFLEPVDLHIVRAGVAEPVSFDPDRFSYDGIDIPDGTPMPAGHAGMRIHYPINRADRHDEFAVFLGASYFRLIGAGQVYGISGRGLTVDTGVPSGEEFPRFSAFWVEAPDAASPTVTVWALLESDAVTGAYQFVIEPGADSQAHVTAALFPRRPAKFGYAPMTSMFRDGELLPRHFDDFRPEVHDSDGLSMHNHNGAWVWRPLSNRERLQITTLYDSAPDGFGLIQRDRDFDHYQDLEARYERRPDLWADLETGFVNGGVELLEIPTVSEVNDNIVAHFVTRDQPSPGDRVDLAYRLHTRVASPDEDVVARVYSSRAGTGVRPGQEDRQAEAAHRLFVVDFIGGGLSTDDMIEPVVDVSRGTASNVTATPNRPIGGWRVFFDYSPGDDAPVEMRVHLEREGAVVSEYWSYLWIPAGGDGLSRQGP